MKKISIITLFPEVLLPYLSSSIMKRAEESGRVQYDLVPLRPFGLGKHKQVDDSPYGGGEGMLMRPEPLFSAVHSVTEREGKKPHTILMTPAGKLFTQKEAERLASLDSLLFICGHYEGIDERVRTGLADEEISIGRYILTGGELPALVVVDAVVRLLEGVLPPESTKNESFSQGLLEPPQYTRPPEFQGETVPPILLSGDHEAIRKWRRENALRRTIALSPDLIASADLTDEEKAFVSRLRKEQ